MPSVLANMILSTAPSSFSINGTSLQIFITLAESAIRLKAPHTATGPSQPADDVAIMLLRGPTSQPSAALLAKESQDITAHRRRVCNAAPLGAGGVRFADRERALGHGLQSTCQLRCRSPGGRPGVSFRRATACVAFSGRRESTSRRRRGRNVTSRRQNMDLIRPSGTFPVRGEGLGTQPPCYFLWEPEGCDSKPRASPWARATAKPPAAMCARAAGPV